MPLVYSAHICSLECSWRLAYDLACCQKVSHPEIWLVSAAVGVSYPFFLLRTLVHAGFWCMFDNTLSKKYRWIRDISPSTLNCCWKWSRNGYKVWQKWFSLAEPFCKPFCYSHRLDANLRVKVADFGLCRDVYERGYYKSDNKKKLPIRWMAPESIEKGQYTSKSDVVSHSYLNKGLQDVTVIWIKNTKIYNFHVKLTQQCTDLIWTRNRNAIWIRY
jgi:hypothetical protein